MSPPRIVPLGEIGRFLRWWRQELMGLLPDRMTQSRAAAGRWLVLASGKDGPRLIEERGAKSRELTSAADPVRREQEIADALAQIAMTGRRPHIGVRLAHDACFSRELNVPAAARGDLVRILALDLERSTPFKAADVLTAHQVLDRSPADGRLAVRQLIVKRTHIAEAQRPLLDAGLSPERVDCWEADGRRAESVDFLARPALSARPQSSASRLLMVSALLLSLAAAHFGIERREAAVAALEAEAATLRGRLAALDRTRMKTEATHGAAAELAALARSEASRALVVDALTRLLPDSDFLTSLRIEGDAIEMQGFSASAAALVPLIERSEVFSQAVLTAPVTFEARLGKERFALKAAIRPNVERGPTTSGKAGAG